MGRAPFPGARNSWVSGSTHGAVVGRRRATKNAHGAIGPSLVCETLRRTVTCWSNGTCPLYDELEVPSGEPLPSLTGGPVCLLRSLWILTSFWFPSSDHCRTSSPSADFAANPATHGPLTTRPGLHHHASPRRNSTSPCLSPFFYLCCSCPRACCTSPFHPGTATPCAWIPSGVLPRLSGS